MGIVIALAVLAIVAAAAAIHTVATDGYRRVPQRPRGTESSWI